MIIKGQELIEVSNKDIINSTVIIPEGVTSIGGNAFYYCTNIGHHTFYMCKNLTNIIIPERLTSIIIGNSVTSIDDWAFYCCRSLTSINVDINNQYYTSVDGVLFTKDMKTLIKYPCDKEYSEYIVPSSVTSIGIGAFYGCTGLTSITIPDSVTSIGSGAFYGCDKLLSKKDNYKAFRPDLICRNYPYEINKLSDAINDISLCNKGYHFCTNLFDIFNYYAGEYGKDFVIGICEVGDKIIKDENSSKCVTNKIKPIRILERSEVLDILNGE